MNNQKEEHLLASRNELTNDKRDLECSRSQFKLDKQVSEEELARRRRELEDDFKHRQETCRFDNDILRRELASKIKEHDVLKRNLDTVIDKLQAEKRCFVN